MGRHRKYANDAAKQAAHRRRKQRLSAETTRLIELQGEFAHLHSAEGKVAVLQKQATAKQLQHQAEAKERDMMDALWVLQTLIADFGYEAVYAHVLQHVIPDAPLFPRVWTPGSSG